MSGPPIPPLQEPLVHRPFSFYPPILNIDHNEFRLRRSTWSEILVMNTKTGEELWIPRRFLGEISSVDEPVMIVGLLKELEYKGGSVWPHERRVIEMPRAVNQGPAPPPPRTDAPVHVVGIRTEPGPERRVSRLIGAALLLGVLASVVVVSLSRRIVSYRGVEQSHLGLTSADDYHAVVRRLGAPDEDAWLDSRGEIQYRMLRYRGRGFVVILMGADRDSARYIGAVDNNWKPVESVLLPKGGDTRAMLKGLPRR
jgi:hypothetical protein